MQTLMTTFLTISIGALLISSCGSNGHKSVTSNHEAMGNGGELSARLCFDDVDGDGDGKVDCEDSDCCWACLPDCGGDPDCEGEDWVMRQLFDDEAEEAQ